MNKVERRRVQRAKEFTLFFIGIVIGIVGNLIAELYLIALGGDQISPDRALFYGLIWIAVILTLVFFVYMIYGRPSLKTKIT